MILKNTGNLFFASIWLIGYFVQNAESFTDFTGYIYHPSQIAGFPGCALAVYDHPCIPIIPMLS
jgi:hypothetical protein